MDEFTISVTIAKRPYRLTIDRNEEEQVRKAAEEINKKIKSYSDSFAFNDSQDLLAMVALDAALSSERSKQNFEMEIKAVESQLTDIDQALGNSLL